MSEAAPAADEAPVEKTEDVPKRARRVIPKFEVSMLTNPTTGLAPFYEKCKRLDDASLSGDKESLAMVMRMYQQWFYRMFPADFGDMCWRVSSVKGVKSAVRDFVFDLRGLTRPVEGDFAPDPSSGDDDSQDAATYQ